MEAVKRGKTAFIQLFAFRAAFSAPFFLALLPFHPSKDTFADGR